MLSLHEKIVNTRYIYVKKKNFFVVVLNKKFIFYFKRSSSKLIKSKVADTVIVSKTFFTFVLLSRLIKLGLFI